MRIQLLRVTLAFLLLGTALAGPALTLRGHLVVGPDGASRKDKRLVFVTNEGKEYSLSGDSVTEAQLRDPQLAGRQWELQGTVQPDGHFEVRRLFTLKDGKRHRVTYYCEVCHIRTHEPGRCMCCQDDTELQEIPAPE